MKALAIGVVCLVVIGSASIAFAQLPGLAPPTSTDKGICGQVDHELTHPMVACDCEIETIESLLIPECEGVSQVVCINDFQYNPTLLMVNAGDTVAWVNLEFCGDFAPEDIVVNTLGIGCSPYHEVVTEPAVPGLTGDTVVARSICSPSDGVLGQQVPTLPPACTETESNVRCHTFATTGLQHYTCETNPGHTALMHGLIAAQ